MRKCFWLFLVCFPFALRAADVDLSFFYSPPPEFKDPVSKGRMPAVITPCYQPDTIIGLGHPLLQFGYQLAKRGFVTLAIGSPGGDAWNPEKGAAQCQPLSFLAYIAANCHTALSHLKE